MQVGVIRSPKALRGILRRLFEMCIRDRYMHDPDLVRRFKNESKAISLLNHPNIVKVYDVDVYKRQSVSCTRKRSMLPTTSLQPPTQRLLLTPPRCAAQQMQLPAALLT